MQTDFNMYSKPFVLGQRADSSLNQVDSYAAEEKIEFGMALMRGTDLEKQAKISDGKKFLGVALRDDLQITGSYQPKSTVAVMTKGRVIVLVQEPVNAGDKAYIHADGTFSKTQGSGETKGIEIGIFASDQETSNNLVILEI